MSVPETKQLTADIGRTIVLDLSTRESEFNQHMYPTERLLDPLQWFSGYVGYWSDKQHPTALLTISSTVSTTKSANLFRTFHCP